MNNPRLPRQTFEGTPNSPQQTRPDIYAPSSLSDVPYGVPTPPQPTNQMSANSQKARKSRKGLVIAIIVGVSILIILTVVALLAGNSQKPAQKQPSTTDNSTLSQTLQPAQAIELEQTNNALSQDLSSLDDEKDLPNNSLEDNTLGL